MCFKGRKMIKIMNIVSVLTLLSVVGMTLTITYWLTFPYEVTNIKKQPMEVLTKELKAGESLFYKIDYCKSMDSTATITKLLVNGLVYHLGTIEGVFDKGCRVNTVQIVIPPELPVGEYHLIQQWSYKVNPVRTIKVQAETETFIIK